MTDEEFKAEVEERKARDKKTTTSSSSSEATEGSHEHAISCAILGAVSHRSRRTGDRLVRSAPQSAALGQVRHNSGQNVVPVFEGWERNADGSFNMVFGYMNRNYEEQPDIPVGPDNNFVAGRRRSGTADALLSAAPAVHVQGPRAEGLRQEGAGVDGHAERPDGEGVRARC